MKSALLIICAIMVINNIILFVYLLKNKNKKNAKNEKVIQITFGVLGTLVSILGIIRIAGYGYSIIGLLELTIGVFILFTSMLGFYPK